MKDNKKASEKTVETSIIAAPLTSANLQVRTQHIPPVEISSGSVILHTRDNVSNGSSGEQVFDGCKKIEGVRVIMTDGTIKFDYKDDPEVTGGQIKIWVNSNNQPDMVLSTPSVGSLLQVKYFNGGHKFGSRSNGSHGRQRRNYSDPVARLLKVEVLKADGRTPLAVVTTDIHKVIDRILIWTEMA